MNSVISNIRDVECFLIDFDGVLTDNRVFLTDSGEESVACSRADGLAFDVLRKLEVNAFIFSTETNPVAIRRAEKLQIEALVSLQDKKTSLIKLVDKMEYDLKKIVYVGNDLNDYEAMLMCGLRVCPSDAHPQIQEIADVVLRTAGGYGVMRDILEQHFKLSLIKYL